jgi:hypothetical protein
MEDKKNIVIKVKYPTANKKEEHEASATKIITEWNIKRILLALVGIIFLISGLYYFVKPDTENTDVQTVANPQPDAAYSEKRIDTIGKPSNETNNIKRSLLTFNIINNEPEGQLELPLRLSKNKPTSIYYFVELTSMRDKTVYHEWLLDGKLITRKKVNISDDSWRTSSRQLFAYTSKTNWLARLVDENGKILNEIQFNVIYE